MISKHTVSCHNNDIIMMSSRLPAASDEGLVSQSTLETHNSSRKIDSQYYPIVQTSHSPSLFAANI